MSRGLFSNSRDYGLSSDDDEDSSSVLVRDGHAQHAPGSHGGATTSIEQSCQSATVPHGIDIEVRNSAPLVVCTTVVVAKATQAQPQAVDTRTVRKTAFLGEF